jgi:hypothetical protein
VGGEDPFSHACVVLDTQGREHFVLISPLGGQGCVLSLPSPGAASCGGCVEGEAAVPSYVAISLQLPWEFVPPRPFPPGGGSGGEGGASSVSVCLCVEDMLVIIGSGNELGLYHCSCLRGGAEGGIAPLAVLCIPTASAVVHACCSTVRLLGGSGRPYAPDVLYFVLESGDAVSCSWAALRQCAMAWSEGGGSLRGAAAPQFPSFNAWGFGARGRQATLLACTNPIGNTLFESFSEPMDLFTNAKCAAADAAAGGGGGGGGGSSGGSGEPAARHDGLVLGGRAPTLASFSAPIAKPTNELALIASTVGTALRRTISGFATRLLGSELKSGLGSALGGGIKSAVRWVTQTGAEGSGAAPAAAAASATPTASMGGGILVPPTLIPALPPRYGLSLDFSIEDGERSATRLVPDPTGRLLLSCDSWGRVMLVEAGELVVVRLWKGYRDASVGWVVCPVGGAQGGRKTLAPVILAPRRGTLEVWSPRSGHRLLSLRVAKTARLVYSVQWGVEGGAAFPLPACHIVTPQAAGGPGVVAIQRLMVPASGTATSKQ